MKRARYFQESTQPIKKKANLEIKEEYIINLITNGFR